MKTALLLVGHRELIRALLRLPERPVIGFVVKCRSLRIRTPSFLLAYLHLCGCALLRRFFLSRPFGLFHVDEQI